MSKPPAKGQKRRSTMADVATSAGVSLATVSMVMNNAGYARIAPETRQRVMDAAVTLDYRTRFRQSNNDAEAKVIGLVIDELSPHAAAFVVGAREAAAEHGFVLATLTTGSSRSLEAASIRFAGRAELAGLIWATQITRAISVDEVTGANPVVLLNCYDPSRTYPAFVPADFSGAYAATLQLIRAGHRRIAHIPGEDWLEATMSRLAGYKEALLDNDLPFLPELVTEESRTQSRARQIALDLFARPDPPTAIFCFSDRTAAGVYDALARLGLRVPEDVSVVGFDNDDFAAHLDPPLSTVELPHREMARRAASYLISHLEDWGSSAFRITKVDCPMVERNSVLPLPPRTLAG